MQASAITAASGYTAYSSLQGNAGIRPAVDPVDRTILDSFCFTSTNTCGCTCKTPEDTMRDYFNTQVGLTLGLYAAANKGNDTIAQLVVLAAAASTLAVA